MTKHLDNLLAEIQSEIAALDPDGHYAKAYRFHELENWGSIQDWIFYDQVTKPAPAILDIGAAYGTLAVFCRRAIKAHVFAIDRVDYFMKPEIRIDNLISFQRLDIEREMITWPFQFDAIILTEVIEHFNFNPEPTMRKILAALKPDGILYLSTPRRVDVQKGKGKYESWKEIPDYPKGTDPEHIDKHIHEYKVTELVGLLEKTGFIVRNLERTDFYRRARIQIAARRGP